ncbi:MAG TPA: metalloregulator ArsR/SmtB family transcription factor [Actinomycetota bacterium]|nr:metalloregulator ArsR/SmtB family transcription factor [Actinomycetota bacterium]
MNVDIDRATPRTSASAQPVVCCVPIRAHGLSKEDAESAALVFKALADPHRIQIVNLLANSQGPVCVCDITSDLDVGQPTASFHLKKLWSAGLLERKKIGTWSYYSLNHEALKALAKILDTKGTRT